MTDEMVVKLIQDDFCRKMDAVHIGFYKEESMEPSGFTYILVDKKTGRQRTVWMFEEDFAGCDVIHAAMTLHRRLVDGAQILVNERKS